MPGIQLTGKPATAATGGKSFHALAGYLNSQQAGGIRPPQNGPASPQQGNGLGATANYATASLRRMGGAANTATAALAAFQKGLAQFNFTRGGGGGWGGGGGRGNGPAAAVPAPRPSGPRGGTPSGASRRRTTLDWQSSAGHLLERAGRHGGVGEATNIAGYALTDPKLLPAVAVGALAFSPQISSLLNSAFQAVTATYRDNALLAYNTGRAGGFNPQGLIDFFGNPLSDPVMLAKFRGVGMGPADAMALQAQFGIGATSQAALIDNVIGLKGMSQDATLGNVDQATLISAQRMLAGGGLGGVTQNSAAMSDMLANATAKGYDKSNMVNSMVSSLTSLAAAGGLGANTGTAAGFISSYADTGTLGGRNGSAAASMQAGLQGLAANPFGSAFSSAVSNRLAGQFQSMSDFKSKAPAIYAMATDGNHPLLAQQIQDYLKAPRPFQAAGIGPILQNDPGTFYSATSGIVTGLTGPGLPGALATNTLLGSPGIGNVYTASAASGAMAAQLAAMGVPAGQVQAIIQAGQLNGVDPRILAAQYKIESGFGQNNGPSSAGALGPFQFLPSTWKALGAKGDPTNFSDSVAAAASYDSSLIAKDGLVGGLSAYGGDPSGAYAAKVLATAGMNAAGPVSPGQAAILSQNSGAGFADFSGAAASFKEFDGSVSKFTGAVNSLIAFLDNPSPGPRASRQNGSIFNGGR